MSTVGTINYDFTADVNKLKKELDTAEQIVKTKMTEAEKVAKEKLKKIQANADEAAARFEKFSSAVKTGATVVGVGLAGIGVAAFKSYSDFEQLTGGVETLFKSSAGIIKGYAENAYKTSGLSYNEYMEQSTNFSAALIKALGGDTKKAAEMVNMAIVDMSDNANKMGTDIESIQMAYSGLAKGNATMLDNLKIGYGGTQTEMLKLAQDMGVVDKNIKSFGDMSFDQSIIAIHKLQEKLGITGTTAEEAGSTISGAFTMSKKSWDNLLLAMATGENVDTATANFVNSVKTLFNNAAPVIKQVIKGVFESIPKIAEEAIGKENWAWVQTIGVGLGIMAVSIKAITLATSAWNIVQGLLNGTISISATMQTIFNSALLANPLTWIVIAIMAVVGALVYFFTQTEIGRQAWSAFTNFIGSALGSIGQWFSGLWNGIVATFSGVVDFFSGIFSAAWGVIVAVWNFAVWYYTTLWNGIVGVFNGVVGFFGGIFRGAWNAITGVFNGVVGFFGGIWNKIVGIFSSIGGAIGGAISNAVKGAINNVLSFAVGVINGFIDSINFAIGVINAIPGVNIGKLGKLSIPKFETGGIVGPQGGGSLIWAGDGGEDEWVVPESKMASLVDKINAQTNGTGGNNYTINVSGVFATSPAEQRRVAEQIREQLELNDKRRFV